MTYSRPFAKRLARHVRNPKQFIAVAHQALKQWLITQSITANLYRKITPIPTPRKWIFVVGCYNSGTTVLLNMLAQHPEISVLDEGVFKTNLLITPEELGWTRLWYKVRDQVRLEADDTHVDAIALQKDWSFFLNTKKPILIEKSIVNSARIPWLQANFPNAHFIFIVRNGYAVAEGIRRKVINRRYPIPTEFGKTYPIELCAEQWVQNNQVIEQDLASVRYAHRLTYEYLCANPTEAIDKLWEFLGIPPPNNRFDAAQTWQIHGKQDVIQNMNSRSFEKLSALDKVAIESVASEMLHQYGYHLP